MVSILTKDYSTCTTVQLSSELRFDIYFNKDHVNIVRKTIRDGSPYKNYLVIPNEVANEIGKLLMSVRGDKKE